MHNFNQILYGVVIFLLTTTLISSPFITSWSALKSIATIFLLSSAVSFVAMIFDDRRGGVSFMYEFFQLFFVALPAFVQISNRVFPWFAELELNATALSYSLLSICQVTFVLTFLHLRHKQRYVATKIKGSVLKKNKLLTVAFFIFIAAVFLAILAGPQNLFVARFGREEAGFTGVTQQFLFMARSLALLSLIMILAVLKSARTRALKRQCYWVIFLISFPFLIINFPPSLPRFVLVGTVIAIFAMYVNLFRTKNKIYFSIASAPSLFLFFPIIKSLGYGALDISKVANSFEFSRIQAYLLRVDFDAFMQLSSTITYLNNGGAYRWGENFLGAIFFFIPRAVWESKPLPSGIVVADSLNFSYTNVSSPLPAEALLGFGLFGPVVASYLISAFILKIEIDYSSAIKTSTNTLSSLYYPLMMAFITIILRGSLNAVAPQFATAFLLLFWLIYSRKLKL